MNPRGNTSTREGVHQPERECADLVHEVFEFVDEAEEFALEYHLTLVMGHGLDEFFDQVVVLSGHVIVKYDARSGLGE